MLKQSYAPHHQTKIQKHIIDGTYCVVFVAPPSQNENVQISSSRFGQALLGPLPLLTPQDRGSRYNTWWHCGHGLCQGRGSLLFVPSLFLRGGPSHAVDPLQVSHKVLNGYTMNIIPPQQRCLQSGDEQKHNKGCKRLIDVCMCLQGHSLDHRDKGLKPRSANMLGLRPRKEE